MVQLVRPPAWEAGERCRAQGEYVLLRAETTLFEIGVQPMRALDEQTGRKIRIKAVSLIPVRVGRRDKPHNYG